MPALPPRHAPYELVSKGGTMVCHMTKDELASIPKDTPFFIHTAKTGGRALIRYLQVWRHCHNRLKRGDGSGLINCTTCLRCRRRFSGRNIARTGSTCMSTRRSNRRSTRTSRRSTETAGANWCEPPDMLLLRSTAVDALLFSRPPGKLHFQPPSVYSDS